MAQVFLVVLGMKAISTISPATSDLSGRIVQGLTREDERSQKEPCQEGQHIEYQSTIGKYIYIYIRHPLPTLRLRKFSWSKGLVMLLVIPCTLVIPKDAAVDAVGEVFQACRFVVKKAGRAKTHPSTQRHKSNQT